MQVFQVSRQGALILVSLFLTRSVLSTEEIGSFEKLLYVGYALSFFWITGLTQGLLSLMPLEKDQARWAQSWAAYLVFLLFSLAIGALLWAFGSGSSELLTGQAGLPHLDLFALYLVLFLPTYLLEHFLLLDGRSGWIVWLGLGSAALYMAAVLLPLQLGFGLQGSIAGLVVFAALKHGLLQGYLLLRARPTWQAAFVGRWMAVSWPLLGYALLGGFHLAFDNWLVGHHYAGDALFFAFYRYGARELPLVIALTGAFSTAMLPLLSKELHSGLRVLRRRTENLFHLLFPASILLMLGSSWWFPYLFTEAFRASVPVFNIFLLLTASRLVFCRPVLMALQDNALILVISGVELLANVVLSFLLVGPFGLEGIAGGTLLAFALEKLLLVIYLRRRHGIGFRTYTPVGWWVSYSLLLMMAYTATLFLS